MAQGVSPRDVPKDERSKQENKYNDLAVGDRIKFSLQELGMKCPNAEIKSLKLVLVAAVASGIGDVWEADFARAPPLVCIAQVRDAPQYDKNGHPRYWITIASKTRSLPRKHLMSDEDFVRIATVEQVQHRPTTVACALSYHSLRSEFMCRHSACNLLQRLASRSSRRARAVPAVVLALLPR